MKTHLTQGAERMIKFNSEAVALKIEKANLEAITVPKTMALAQENGLWGNRSKSTLYAKMVLKRNPQFTGAYFGYEPDADRNDLTYLANNPSENKSMNKNGRFLPYWYLSGTEVTLTPLIDMEKSLYYQGCKDKYRDGATDNAMVTEPYFYEGKMIVEQTYPIVIEGKFAGVAGVDRALTDLLSFLNRFKPYQTSKLVLISRMGKIISSNMDLGSEERFQHSLKAMKLKDKRTDESQLNRKMLTFNLKDTDFNDILQVFYKMGKGGFSLSKRNDPLDGETYYFAGSKISTGDWTVVMRVAEKEIFEPIKAVLMGVLTAAVFIIGLQIFLAIQLSRRMAKPIDDVIHASKNIAKGNFDISLPRSKIPEIDMLTVSLGDTANKLKDLTQNLEKEKVQLSHEVAERKLAQKELTRHRDQLEELVQERTVDLIDTNKKLEKEKEKAEAANRAKSVFLANMSHEIRTPMNAILGFAEIMKDKIDDPRHANYLQSIHSCGKSLLSLINDILDLSKVEAGKLKLKYTPVSLSFLFDEMRTVFGEKIKEKELELVTEIPSGLPETLLLDEIRLRQILVNLMGNAVKFTDSGSIKLSGRHHNSDNSDGETIDLLIMVEDTGIGIPDEQKERIFEAFEQHGDTDACIYGGTGLGLAITRRLAEVMEGEISVDSEVGRGSIFKVFLKNVETASIAFTENNLTDQIDYGTVLFEKSTILIADDIEYNREVIKGIFEEYGLSFLEAVNGRHVIEKARQYHPDLILLDMKMPEMSGYKAAEILHNDKALMGIPIVAVTASAMKEDKAVISKLCDAYLQKPVSKSALISEVMKFLPHTVEKQSAAIGNVQDLKSVQHSEALAMSPDLEKILRSKKSYCKELSETMVIDEIENFAKEMQALGARYQYQPLIKWGQALWSFAVAYDIENIQNMLMDFETDNT